MNMGNTSIQENPFHIPEIRRRISRFVSVKDAISCVQVSKDWSKEFVFPIWYSINFKIHNTFENLGADIIAKHGHHIRIIKNLETQTQLDTLHHPSINKVQDLGLKCTNSARFRSLCMDFISNNNMDLKRLRIEMDANEIHDLSSRMISTATFIPHSSVSKLTYIRLRYVCLSRDSFALLLRRCPLLKFVDLQVDVALFSRTTFDTFKHAGVTTLQAPVKQIFNPDPEFQPSPLGSSLLVHFPNLKTWNTYNLEATLIVPIERIKSEVKMCCPKLHKISTWITRHAIVRDILANVGDNLTSVTFAYAEISEGVILALLLHKTTLSDISTITNRDENLTERDDIPPADDHFQASGRVLQLLPRCCPNLLVFVLECHEMDMDHVEEAKWICKKLQKLRVRIRGLDTKERVNKALQLWKDGRIKKNTKNEGEGNMTEDEDETDQSINSHLTETKEIPIETRVARHLLTFDDLDT
ncbi:hypothetical protein BGX26_002641, partial [Mortierella sp. AD094]